MAANQTLEQAKERHLAFDFAAALQAVTDHAGAIEAYASALALEPPHVAALDAVVRSSAEAEADACRSPAAPVLR